MREQGTESSPYISITGEAAVGGGGVYRLKSSQPVLHLHHSLALNAFPPFVFAIRIR